MSARNINATYPNVLRATGDVQTDNGLLWTPPAYKHRTSAPQIQGGSIVSDSKQIIGVRLKQFALLNVAAASPVGIGWRFVNYIWIGGRYDGTTFTDVSSSLQARTAVAVQVAGADQTGFAIGCREKFDWVSANFTTAETNAGGVTVPDHAVKYSKGGSWSAAYTAGLTDNFTTADAVWGTGIKNFAWLAPSDWTVSASLTGVADSYYWLWFDSAQREALDVAAQVTGVEIGGFAGLVKSLAQNGIFEEDPQFVETSYYSPWANGVVAYFGTADAGNLVQGRAESA